MNVVVAKFNVHYKDDGVLFMAISPGVVELGHYANSMYPRFSLKLKYLGFSLMHIRSYSRRDTGIDGFRRQACGVCTSFQGPNLHGGIRSSGQVCLGEG